MPTYTINPFGRTNRLDLAGVTTTSGALTTLVELTDTPSVYEDGKYLKSTVAGTEWATGDGGITVHSELTNLAYADSGHTGFAPTSHSHTESDISDLDKYTEAEVNTISGALNTKISGKADTSHTHDDRYYTESEVDTISGSLNTKVEAKPDTLLELTDTPAAYDEGKYLKSSAGAIEFVTPEGIALVAEVKEENISAITKGQMCAITGSSGAKFEVGLCDCDDATKIRVIGLAQTNIAQNEEGVVVYKGELLNVDSRTTNTDVNPNAEEWNAGDLLYVSQTPGGLTKVRPTSGRCIKAGRTQKGNSSSDTFLAIVDVNSICACAAAGEDLCHRMGDVAGVNKVSYRSYDNNEVAALDSYGNLTLSGTVDGRDVATDGSKLDGIATGADVTGDNPPQAHIHDDRYYTDSEVDTISGTLQNDIDNKADKGINNDITSTTALTQVTRATGGTFNIAIGGAAGDDFTVDTDKLVVEGDTGRVGIGITTPAYDLDVRSNDASTVIAQFQGTDASRARVIIKAITNGADPFITFSEPDDNHWSVGLDDSNSNALVFSTGVTLNNPKVTIDINGNIAVSGTVDGRDVDADGTKLDGIENSATADQTKADIDGLAITTVGTLDTGNADAIVTKATVGDINTGTEAIKVVTPDTLAGSNIGTKNVVVKCIADDTALTTGNGKAHFTVPIELNGMDLVSVGAHVYTTSSSGIPTFQIYNLTQTADMLTTEITIDETEYDSKDATTSAVIDTNNDDVATGDVLRFDCDVAGTDTTGMEIRTGFRL